MVDTTYKILVRVTKNDVLLGTEQQIITIVSDSTNEYIDKIMEWIRDKMYTVGSKLPDLDFLEEWVYRLFGITVTLN